MEGMFGRGDSLDNSFWTGFGVATFLTAQLWIYAYSHAVMPAELSQHVLTGHWKDILLWAVTDSYNTSREPKDCDFHIVNVSLI